MLDEASRPIYLRRLMDRYPIELRELEIPKSIVLALKLLW
jgi:hypothetical protein